MHISERGALSRLGRDGIYEIADLLTARKGISRRINGESIRIPPRWARYYPQEYQPETHAFLQASCRPGTVAIDVGAHIGIFSIVMARAVGKTGRILSFEPTPDTRHVLHRVVRCNGMASVVDVRSAAVSGKVGSSEFHTIPVAASNANSLVPRGGGSKTIDVPTVSVDSVVDARAPLSCLKIDAEGSELEVLRGAERSIARCRPAIALDVHPDGLIRAGGALAGLHAWVVDYGYRGGELLARLARSQSAEIQGPFAVHLTPE